eukprot:TRINITY_DN4815_c0_g1_i1.p1 TRINITY_DN4815_c0_g1~~TRINITY_DN4815_c0_g1_i1.p1  ORF type:complete len:609 (-),score=123.16 TRINITY_DN4815_c0_g1_i1:9-1835(-)
MNLQDPEIKKVNLRDYFDRDYFSEFEQRLLEQEDRLKKLNIIRVDEHEVDEDPTVLKIKLKRAKNIVRPNSEGASDVYVVIQCGFNDPVRSQTVAKSLSPKFEEKYSFEIDNLYFNELVVRLFTDGQLYGEHFIDLAKLDRKVDLKDPYRAWFRLYPQTYDPNIFGEVLLEISRTGGSIIQRPPIRERKNGYFDLDLEDTDLAMLLNEDNYIDLLYLIDRGKHIYKKLKSVADIILPVRPRRREPEKRSASLNGSKRSFVRSSKKTKRKKSAATQSQFVWDLDLSTRASIDSSDDSSEDSDEFYDPLNIQNFPDEILIRIFSHLSGRDKIELSVVCLTWSRVLQDQFLKTKVEELEQFIVTFHKTEEFEEKTEIGRKAVILARDTAFAFYEMFLWENSVIEYLSSNIFSYGDKRVIISKYGIFKGLFKLCEQMMYNDFWKGCVERFHPSFNTAKFNFLVEYFRNYPSEFDEGQKSLLENSVTFISDINRFYKGKSVNALGSVNAATIMADCITVSSIYLDMIQNQRYKNMEQLEELLWGLCMTLILVHLKCANNPKTNAIFQKGLKSKNYNMKKIGRLIKPHVHLVPYWLIQKLVKCYPEEKSFVHLL